MSQYLIVLNGCISLSLLSRVYHLLSFRRQREVREETGLDIISATPIAIYSEPRFSFTNEYGAEHQMLAIVFRVDEWSGVLVSETDETVEARFFSVNELPDIPDLYRETLEDLKNFDSQLILK